MSVFVEMGFAKVSDMKSTGEFLCRFGGVYDLFFRKSEKGWKIMFKIKKHMKILCLLMMLVWISLTSCAVTSKDYELTNREELSIISVLIAFEESYNKKHQDKFLSLIADEAQIMWGKERNIVSKAEFTKILPEGFEAISTIRISRPKIKIDGNIATVQAEWQANSFYTQSLFKLKKFRWKWLILAISY
jgi:hypothetical protein